MSTENKKWQEIVENSKGQSAFVPEQFLEEMKKITTLREKFNDMINEIAKKEIEMNVANNNLWLKIRNYFDDAGKKHVWSKDVNLNADALREGIYIINFLERQGR